MKHLEKVFETAVYGTFSGFLYLLKYLCVVFIYTSLSRFHFPNSFYIFLGEGAEVFA